MSNKAAIIPAKFAKLVVKETEIPTPKGKEILIKIHSSAINPVDYKIQSLGRFFEEFPRVLGSDVAGVIENVGPDQKRFKKGEKVFSFVPIFMAKGGATDYGAFQQYTLSTEDATGHLPEGTSFDSASTIPLALSTAADGLYDFLGLDLPTADPKSKDEWLLVWGGASSVGQFTIQLAVASGYRVVTTASKAGHADLRELGASETLDYHDSDILTQISEITGGKLRLIYDAISSQSTVKQTLDALPDGGKIAYTQLTPETAKIEVPSNISYYRVFAGNLQGKNKTLGRQTFDWAQDALKDGRLVGNPVVIREGGLDTLQETLDYYRENGISNGKYVINP